MRKLLAVAVTLSAIFITVFAVSVASSEPRIVTTIVITGSGGLVPPTNP